MRELASINYAQGAGFQLFGNLRLLSSVLVILALWLAACDAGTTQPGGPAGYGGFAGGTGGAGGIVTGGQGGTGGASGAPFSGGTGGTGASGPPGVDAGSATGGAAGLPAAGTPSGGTGGPALDAGEPPVDASNPDVPLVIDGGPVGDGAVVAGTGGSGGAGGAPPLDGGPGPTGDAAEVCARWNADTADMSEGTWSGNVATCDPGDISAEGRANALRVLNLYRWLADLPAIQTDPEFDRKAQACALIMRANNNNLSHYPPQSWACWTAEGAEGAGSCNISSGPGVGSVSGYMIDMGNPTTIGHRRWILSNSIGPTGLGSTDGASCMWTMGRSNAGKTWVAWPPPGVIPFEATGDRWATLDSTGWTIQSDTINLSGAQVQVTSDGAALQVTVTQLLSGYGSRYAIRFNPQGWQTQAGKTYSVTVSGVSPAISYDVEVVNCG